MEATRDQAGTFAFVYFPTSDHLAKLDLRRLQGVRHHIWWYDPRTGVGTDGGETAEQGIQEFKSPSNGPDWVLVLDNSSKGYSPPGLGFSSTNN